MDPMIKQALLTIVVDIVALAVIVPIIKRIIAKRLDEFDQKRDEARIERQRKYDADEMWQDAMTSGMRSMLRAELVGEHRKAVDRGYADLTTKEYVQRTYESYHKLGGNDIGTALYEEIMAMPTEKQRQ